MSRSSRDEKAAGSSYGPEPQIKRLGYAAALGAMLLLIVTASDAHAIDDEATLELEVIATEGDAAPGTSGEFDLDFVITGNGAPLISAAGRVYFFSASTEIDDFFQPREGIWLGDGNTLTPLILEGTGLPAFAPTEEDCIGVGETCGELFGLSDVFYVSPDGEIIVRVSRDDAIGTSAIVAGTQTGNLRPLLTRDQDPLLDFGRVSLATDGGLYLINSQIGTAPFGEPDGGLTDFAAPFIGGAAPFVTDPVTIVGLNGTSSSIPNFATFGLNENGDLLFEATLSDGSTALYADPGAAGAATSLLGRTGEAAPGLASAEFVDLAQARANDNGTGLLLASWRDPNGGTGNTNLPRLAIWRFGPDGALTLVVSERLVDGDPVYESNEGPRTVFTRPFNNFVKPVIAPNGDIFFLAAGRQVNEDGVIVGDPATGLWRVPADGGPLELVLREREGDRLGTQVSPVDGARVASIGFGNSFYGFDSAGNLVIDLITQLPDNSAVRGIYIREPDGSFERVIQEGDQLEVAPGEFRTVERYSFDSTDYVGGTIAAFRNDRLAFNVRFDDDTVAVVRASFVGPEVIVTEFVWSGGCGDDNWHTTCDSLTSDATSNWADPDGRPTEAVPGDAGGTETAMIVGADVVITQRPVNVRSLDATGSLTVGQPLILGEDSSIENLSFLAGGSIETAGVLTLLGTARLDTAAQIRGAGRVVLDAEATATIAPDTGTIDLSNTLEVAGRVTHSAGTVQLTGGDALLRILPSGQYEIESGTITDDSDGVHVENGGTFVKSGTGTATIDAFFENLPGAGVNVVAGELRFTDPSNWAGELNIASDATAVFDNTVATFATPGGETFEITGGGLLRIDGGDVIIGGGAATTFALEGESGGVRVDGGASLTGDNLLNTGTLELREVSALDLSTFENRGELRVDGGHMVTYTGDGTFANSGRIVVADGTLLLQNGATDFDEGTELDVADGGTVQLSNTAVTFSATTTTTGGGKLLLGDDPTEITLIDGATLINGLSAAIELDFGFTQGLEIASGARVSGSGVIANSGTLAWTGGTIEGEITLENSANEAETGVLIIGDPEQFLDQPKLGARLDNEGRTYLVTSLDLSPLRPDAQSINIMNSGEFYLDGSAGIFAEPSFNDDFFETGFENRGELVKSGGESSTIDVRFVMPSGSIDVRSGELNFFSELQLLGDDRIEINIAEGATLQIAPGFDTAFGEEEEAPQFFMSTATTVQGSGTLIFDDLDSVIADDLRLLVNTDWRSGLMVAPSRFLDPDAFGALRIGNDTTPVILQMTGENTETRGSLDFLVAAGSEVVQANDWFIVTSDTSIDLHGRYSLSGRLGPQFGGSLTPNPRDVFRIHPTGRLTVPDGASARIDKPLTFEPGGVVELGTGASLQAENIVGTNFETNALLTGNWQLAPTASVSSRFRLNRLGEGTRVALAEGSQFMNLPRVLEDFTIDAGATLELSSADFFVDGDIDSAGFIVGTNSVVSATGDIRTSIGSVLGGNGIVFRANVEAGGTVAPGVSPGILTIDGNYTQTTGARLEIEIGGTTPGTDYDQLIVTGTATFEAGTAINLSLIDADPTDADDTPYVPRTGDVFDFVMADDLVVEGDIGDLISLAGLPSGLRFEPRLGELDGAFMLQLEAFFGSTLLETSGLTGPQRELAGVIDAASIDSASQPFIDFALAIDDIADPGAQRSALSAASLSFASALYDFSSVVTEAQKRGVERALWLGTTEPRQTSSLAWGTTAPGAGNSLDDRADFFALASQLSGGEARRELAPGLVGIAQLAYLQGDFDESAAQVGMDYDGAALDLGLMRETASGRFGALLQLGEYNGDADDRRGDVDADSIGVSLFGSWSPDSRNQLFGSVSGGRVSLDYEREFSVPGAAFRADGDTDADYTGALVGWRGSFEMAGFRVHPAVTFDYLRVEMDEIVEEGAGPANLVIDDDVLETLIGRVGWEITGANPRPGRVAPRAGVYYRNRLQNDAPTVDARFSEPASGTFAIPIDAINEDGWELTLGLDWRQSDRVRIALDYQGIVNDGSRRQHALTGAFLYRF